MLGLDGWLLFINASITGCYIGTLGVELYLLLDEDELLDELLLMDCDLSLLSVGDCLNCTFLVTALALLSFVIALP